MPIMIAAVLTVAVLLAAYLAALAPNQKRGARFVPFEKVPIAHRGFFDNGGDCPENSLAAFAKAVENGFGIELDVQMTADGQLVVFHDDDLIRMCGAEQKLEDCTLEQLRQYRLLCSEQSIPLFAEVLKLIGGTVPLIVEIKDSKRWRETCVAAAALLDAYAGCYCVESFNPLVVRWYRKNRPDVLRGQLSTDYFKDEPALSFWKKWTLSNLLYNGLTKPDFIAYRHIYKNRFSYRLLRKIYKVKNVAWTVRSEQERADAADVFTCIIFDGFTPEQFTETGKYDA